MNQKWESMCQIPQFFFNLLPLTDAVTAAQKTITQSVRTWLYNVNIQPRTKSCLNKHSWGLENLRITARISYRKIKLSGLHSFYLCLRKCSSPLLPMSFSFCHRIYRLVITPAEVPIQTSFVTHFNWGFNVRSENCFQAQLSIGELCAPPILSLLFASESISFTSHSWEFNRKLKWIPF